MPTLNFLYLPPPVPVNPKGNEELKANLSHPQDALRQQEVVKQAVVPQQAQREAKAEAKAVEQPKELPAPPISKSQLLVKAAAEKKETVADTIKVPVITVSEPEVKEVKVSLAPAPDITKDEEFARQLAAEFAKEVSSSQSVPNRVEVSRPKVGDKRKPEGASRDLSKAERKALKKEMKKLKHLERKEHKNSSHQPRGRA